MNCPKLKDDRMDFRWKDNYGIFKQKIIIKHKVKRIPPSMGNEKMKWKDIIRLGIFEHWQGGHWQGGQDGQGPFGWPCVSTLPLLIRAHETLLTDTYIRQTVYSCTNLSGVFVVDISIAGWTKNVAYYTWNIPCVQYELAMQHALDWLRRHTE